MMRTFLDMDRPAKEAGQSLFPFITDIPVKLAHVRRCTNVPVTRTENIQEHSFMVALISYLIAEDISCAEPQTAATKALFHDFEEAITGDITRDFKYLDRDFRQSLASVEPQAMEAVVEQLPKTLQGRIFKNWEMSKDNTIEGRIVEVADSIAMLQFIHEETLHGNQWVLNQTWDLAINVAYKKLEELPPNTIAHKTIDEFRSWHHRHTRSNEHWGNKFIGGV